ncbi:hypothetical protein PCANC_06080 [Puccinia coronata f. sp. avenae]|uniref:Integrase catalytic domain-containing protein n=1 Tax=Puccinia coronata f. sp. avenae TaxID=200324 RepID=A0A2N5VTT4_9BASI|nr:hypothetical protein PCANC_06080 [Puccinia coronata f. sp. avenae]
MLDGELTRPEILLIRIPMKATLKSCDDLLRIFAPRTKVSEEQTIPKIIYSGTRNLTFQVMKVVNDARQTYKHKYDPLSPFIRRYHSVTGDNDKAENMDDYNKDKFPIISSTMALGLGQNMKRAKSESEKRILEFFAEIKNKLNRVPAYFHSDRGGEFSSTKFLSSLQELGVSIERGPADSPQTNGVAERFNGVLLEKIKCMLLQSKVPQSLWHEAACHASDILNVLPHSSLNWQSPSSILVKAHSLIEPDRTSMPLVPFGARVIVHQPNKLKVKPSGVEMLFLGFEEFSDAARFLDPLTQRIVITRDYVVPTIELGSDGVTIHKDLKTLPTEVNTSSSDTSSVETARLFIRGHRSRSKPSSPPESRQQSPLVNQQVIDSEIQESEDDESDVSFETEARRVLQRNLHRCLRRNVANQSVETVRPNNVYNSVSERAPNQGRHFNLPPNALNRLRPSWAWADETQRPQNEICGDVDKSNIVSTRRRPTVRMPGGLDEQPDVVNLVESVTVKDALASELEKPLWLEAMRNEHASQISHFTGDLGKNKVDDFDPEMLQDEDARMDALAVTPLCLRVALTIDNKHGCIPLSSEDRNYIAERACEIDVGFTPCRCSNCLPEAADAVLNVIQQIDVDNFTTILQDPCSFEEDKSITIMNRKSKAPPTKATCKYSDIDAAHLVNYLVDQFAEFYEYTLGESPELLPSDFFGHTQATAVVKSIDQIREVEPHNLALLERRMEGQFSQIKYVSSTSQSPSGLREITTRKYLRKKLHRQPKKFI